MCSIVRYGLGRAWGVEGVVRSFQKPKTLEVVLIPPDLVLND